MQKSEKTAKKTQASRNNITLLAGDSARPVIEKLVYGTKLANDHILHELEARYGDVIAQYIMEKMPK